MIFFDLFKYYFLNKQTLNLSREEVIQLQHKKFLRLVSFVAENSPYYKKIIQENNIDIKNCSPNDFPVLTKAAMLDNFDAIVTDRNISLNKIKKFLDGDKNPEHLFLGKYYIIHTSGSSGTIGYFLYDRKELVQGISPLLRNNGIQFFQKFAYIAATNGHFAGATMASLAKNIPFLYQEIKMFNIDTPFNELITGLNYMQPTTVSGYAFALKELSKAQRKGLLSINPKTLQSGGEPLTDNDKQYIQETFNVQITNVYAASEHLIMGIGCDRYNGLYLMDDNLYFEIFPEFSYITNLYNYTLPLIRYKMSDRFEVIENTNNTLPFTKIRNVVGRSEHYPWFINDNGEKDFIRPNSFDEIAVVNVERFQIHLTGKNHFIVKICLVNDLTKDEIEKTVYHIKEKVRELLKDKMMTKITFDIHVVDHLWAHPKTGKFNIIVVS